MKRPLYLVIGAIFLVIQGSTLHCHFRYEAVVQKIATYEGANSDILKTLENERQRLVMDRLTGGALAMAMVTVGFAVLFFKTILPAMLGRAIDATYGSAVPLTDKLNEVIELEKIEHELERENSDFS